jgi:hypothetical protein
MKSREMDKLTKHFDTFFHQKNEYVLHPVVMTDPHIDTLIYEPNEAYPYWKLVTMGASDYRMPAPKKALGDRNEYIMFIDPKEDLKDKAVLDRYMRYLMEVAMYPVNNHCFVSYGHSMEWAIESGEEMTGAYLEMPQLISDPAVMRCKLGLFKTAICLQVILLTRKEIDRLLEIGSERFSYWLYPEDPTATSHFLCEITRSNKF